MKINSVKKNSVFVAMSGGVDSSVTAALLKEQGYSVTGVFMKNWSGDDYGIQADCPWEADQKDAEKVCKVLNIPFMSYNFEKEYRERVIAYFFDEYKKGRTPNPDVMCNKEIKFDVFLEKALADGADIIATGHYARSFYNNNLGLYELKKGMDQKKDQSYFLYTLNQAQLSKTLFPVGELTKVEVRKLAEKFNLPTAKKKDSQGICFVGKIDVSEFLRENIAKKTGDIIDLDTQKIIGTHEGIFFYTVGQRTGLGISGYPEAYFVVDKDIEKNILYVAKGKANKLLFKKEVFLESIHLISGVDLKETEEIKAKVSVRYRTEALEATITKKKEEIKIVFNKPVRAVAPGQSAVFYQDDVCLGGGVIF